MKMSRMLLQITFATQILPMRCYSARIQKRVVGGEEIDIKDVPYMLSFRLHDKHACGAAVISRDWGVTAAHCAKAYVTDPLKEITIRSGSSMRRFGGMIHSITKIIPHEKYSVVNEDYDIAVFKVYPPFEYSDVTQPVRLPVTEVPFDDALGLIAGWGYYSLVDPKVSESLMYVIIPKVSRPNCERDYVNRFYIKPNYICYGYKEGGEDACKGDSGGPLVNENNILIGIAVWGNSCALKNFPGIYIGVKFFRDWIRDKTGV